MASQKTHKVAIIECFERGCPSCNVDTVISKITDFAEIDEETFKLLRSAAGKWDSQFFLIEQPTNQSEWIAKTVADFVEEEKQRKIRAANLEKAREVSKNARKLKREAMDRARKRKLLEELKLELENEQENHD